MLAAHNFSYGLLTPVLGYLMSCLGGFLGLRCTSRAMAVAGRQRLRWLLLAALCIGTTGLWLMHFIAMLGFTMPGQVIRYDVPVTIASMLIAVVVVGIGLLVVGFGRPGPATLLPAGLFTGLGIAAMHFTGMAAMRMPGQMSFSPGLVALSVLIAVAAATAALWAGLTLSGLPATLGASALMGAAVSGMHYTGMAAMTMWPAGGMGMTMTPGGATALSFVLPLVIGISVLAFIMTAIIVLSPTGEEMSREAELLARIAAVREGGPLSRRQDWPPASAGRHASPPGRPGGGAQPPWPH